MAKLIKLARMVGVMQTDVPFIACVIYSPCTFTYLLGFVKFLF